MAGLVERYADQILGVLSCYDRVIVRGRLAEVDYAKGMAADLRAHGVRLFDFPQWAKPFRDEIRDNTERLAQEHGIEVRFVRGNERKETIVAEVLEQRGDSHGLVAILSALELCDSFAPRYDKKIAGPRDASPRNANTGARACARTAPKVEDAGRSCRGFNFFSEQDLHLFGVIVRGENTITGFRNRDVPDLDAVELAWNLRCSEVSRRHRAVLGESPCTARASVDGVASKPSQLKLFAHRVTQAFHGVSRVARTRLSGTHGSGSPGDRWQRPPKASHGEQEPERLQTRNLRGSSRNAPAAGSIAKRMREYPS
jgi:hypothetical protein